MLKSNFIRCAMTMLIGFSICATAAAQNKAQPAGNQSNVRGAVQSFFSLLKSQKYSELYDFLPSQLQSQTSREQMTASLTRLGAYLTVERLEVGRIQQKGDFAVVDTTIYGNLKRTMNMNGEEVKEGRVSVQQYLLKENGRWKITTADNRTRDFFLKRNPEFKKQFQLSQPQFAFKQKGRWTPLGQPPNVPRQ